MKRKCTRFNKPNVITSSSVAFAVAVDVLCSGPFEIKMLKKYLQFHTLLDVK